MGTVKRVSEKVVQAAVVRCYEAFGCIVYAHSEPRAALVTPGYPDLSVYCPRRHHFWWHEVKAPKGKLRPSQIAFKRVAESCDETVVVGGLAEARAQLVKIGLALE